MTKAIVTTQDRRALRLNKGRCKVTEWTLSLLVSIGIYLFSLLICGLFFSENVLVGWSLIFSDISSGNWNSAQILAGLLSKEALFLCLVSLTALSWSQHHRILFSVLSILPFLAGWPAAQEQLESAQSEFGTSALWIWKTASIVLLIPPFVICGSLVRLLLIRIFKHHRAQVPIQRQRFYFVLQTSAHGFLLVFIFVSQSRAVISDDSSVDHSADHISPPKVAIIVAPGLTASTYAGARDSLSAPNAQFLDQALSVFFHRPTVPLAMPMRRELLTCQASFRSGQIANSDVLLSDVDLNDPEPAVLLEADLRVISFRDQFESLWLWGGKLALEHLIVRRITESWVEASPVLGVVSAGLYLVRLQGTLNPDQGRMRLLRKRMSEVSKELSMTGTKIGRPHTVLIELPDLFSGKSRSSRQTAALEETLNFTRDLASFGMYPSHRLVLLGLPPERVMGSDAPPDATASPVLIWSGPESNGEPDLVGTQEQSLGGSRVISRRAIASFGVRKRIAGDTGLDVCGTDGAQASRMAGSGLSNVQWPGADSAVSVEIVAVHRASLAERLIGAPWTTRTRCLDPIWRGASGVQRGAESEITKADFQYLIHQGSQTYQIELGRPLGDLNETARVILEPVFSFLPLGASGGAGSRSVPLRLRTKRGVLY